MLGTVRPKSSSTVTMTACATSKVASGPETALPAADVGLAVKATLCSARVSTEVVFTTGDWSGEERSFVPPLLGERAGPSSAVALLRRMEVRAGVSAHPTSTPSPIQVEESVNPEPGNTPKCVGMFGNAAPKMGAVRSVPAAPGCDFVSFR